MKRIQEYTRYASPFLLGWSVGIAFYHPAGLLRRSFCFNAYTQFSSIFNTQRNTDLNMVMAYFFSDLYSMSGDYVLQSTRQGKHGEKVLS